MIIPRLNWNAFFMMHAHLYATRATCDRGPELLFNPGRHGVGAVLVRNNMIVAGGYNGSPPGYPHCNDEGHLMVDCHCVKTLHAEMNALMQCAKVGVSSDGCTMYTTASPCWDCSKAMIRAGIKKLFFSDAYNSRYELSPETKRLLNDCGVMCYCLPRENLGIHIEDQTVSDDGQGVPDVKGALENPEEYARKLINERKKLALS